MSRTRSFAGLSWWLGHHDVPWIHHAVLTSATQTVVCRAWSSAHARQSSDFCSLCRHLARLPRGRLFIFISHSIPGCIYIPSRQVHPYPDRGHHSSHVDGLGAWPEPGVPLTWRLSPMAALEAKVCEVYSTLCGCLPHVHRRLVLCWMVSSRSLCLAPPVLCNAASRTYVCGEPLSDSPSRRRSLPRTLHCRTAASRGNYSHLCGMSSPSSSHKLPVWYAFLQPQMYGGLLGVSLSCLLF